MRVGSSQVVLHVPRRLPNVNQSMLERIPSPKRTPEDRKGVYSWVQYHAGFSPRFVGSLIEYLKLGPETELLDPFMGTGVSCVEARRRGVPSTGIELNGFAYYLARARLAWSFSRLELDSVLRNLKTKRDNPPRTDVNPGFRRWFTPEDETPERLVELGFWLKEIENRDLRDFMITALALTIRSRARSSVGTNPAWVKLGKGKPGPKVDLIQKVSAKAMQMFEDQLKIRGNTSTPTRLKRMDVRHFRPARRYSAIVSSPPYLSRLDYVVAHRVENDLLANLGLQTSPDSLRNRLVGGVLIGNGPVKKMEAKDDWGDLCLEKLAAVEAHQSKGSKSYYHPLMLRYFDDMFHCLGEFYHWLGRKGTMVLVAQSSYYKEIEIPLPQILQFMAKANGFKDPKIMQHVVVTSHIGNMDPDQRGYVSRKWLYEDVIIARKT